MNSPFASSRSYLFALILTGICSGAAHAINPLASLAFFGLTIKAFFKPLLGTDNSRGTAYENMWQQYYQKNADLTNNAENLAEFFTNALENNTSLANHLTTTSDFMFGLSSSHYQIEGGIGQECACHDFYEKNNKALPGRACDFWNKYEIFIQDLRYCGAKTFRMSISWERVYPYGPDNPDFTALAHYRKIIQALKNADIEPIIVLHHYTVPTWFAEMGGFENKRNITFFVDFAQTVYIELHDLVRYWSTFNAIEGYAFKGYYTGNGAPGKKGDLQKTADVMGNMLLAHAHTYKALKNIYEKKYKNSGSPEPLIGIQKNIFPLDPYPYHNPIASIACEVGNMLQNEGFYGFFSTGTFELYVPLKVYSYRFHKNAPHCLDWIGVNAYAFKKRLKNGTFKIDKALETNNENYHFCPEVLARATEQIYNRIVVPVSHAQNRTTELPILITENGIAAKNDEQRTLFFQRALFTIGTMIDDGYPIIAYTPWASHDNFEWGADLGTKRYGMFEVDFDNLEACYAKRPEQRLKKGSMFFKNFVHAFYQTNKKIVSA